MNSGLCYSGGLPASRRQEALAHGTHTGRATWHVRAGTSKKRRRAILGDASASANMAALSPAAFDALKKACGDRKPESLFF
jgi:hypothetical protein